MDQKSSISNNITREMAQSHMYCLKYREYERTCKLNEVEKKKENRSWDQTNGMELVPLIHDRFGVFRCHSFTDNIAFGICAVSIIVILFFSSLIRYAMALILRSLLSSRRSSILITTTERKWASERERKTDTDVW